VASVKAGSASVKPFVERRTARREPVRLAAKVAVSGAAMDCTVRDVTDAGAKVYAPTVLGLPDQVFLLVMDTGTVIRARRIWADFPWFGLKFVDTQTIEETTDAACAPLKAAWTELQRSLKTKRPPTAA